MKQHIRQKFVVSNWKMHTTASEAQQLTRVVVDGDLIISDETMFRPGKPSRPMDRDNLLCLSLLPNNLRGFEWNESRFVGWDEACRVVGGRTTGSLTAFISVSSYLQDRTRVHSLLAFCGLSFAPKLPTSS